MKILWCSWKDLAHPLAGGAEIYTNAVTTRLAAQGHEVHLAVAAVADAPPLEVKDGVTIHRKGGALFGVYRHARSVFERDWSSWDVVVDEINTKPFSSPLWVRSTPVVGFCHQLAREVWFYETPWPFAVIGRYVLEPLWLRRYKHTPVACVSASTALSLAAAGVLDTTVVPMGSQFPPRPAVERAVQPTLVAVGRISSMKRPFELLRAHEILLETRPDAKLWFIGSGPEESALQRAASTVPNVELLGRLDDEAKAVLMAQAWVLVSASVREGWGLVVSEAAAMGTHSVTYRVPGLVDSVSATNGVLCDPNPQALACALGEHLDALSASQPSSTGTSSWDETTSAFEALLYKATLQKEASQ